MASGSLSGRANRSRGSRTNSGSCGTRTTCPRPPPLEVVTAYPLGRAWDRYLWVGSLRPGAARRASRRLSTVLSMERAIILLSGGIDSAVTLWWAKQQGWDIRPLTFDYFGRPRREHDAVLALTSRIGTGPLRRVDLPFLKEVDDLRKEGFENRRLLDSPEGYIPGRNLIFYGLAGHYAELDAVRYIVGGHNGIDPESFPDASPKFFNFLNSVFHLSLWSYDASPVQILVPLSGKSKDDVIRMGLDMKVPFDVTWSCYWDRDVHCGTCVSCRDRSRGPCPLPTDATGPAAGNSPPPLRRRDPALSRRPTFMAVAPCIASGWNSESRTTAIERITSRATSAAVRYTATRTRSTP